MFKYSFLVLTFVMFAGYSATQADTLYLSDYLGVSSGSTTFTSHGPYTSVNSTSLWGFGRDTAGSWTSLPVRLSGVGTFDNALGMHPNAEIIFHLDAILPMDTTASQFSAWIGNDMNTNGSGNARYRVYLDNVLVHDVSHSGTSNSYFNVAITGQSKLKLKTDTSFFSSNHAVWAAPAIEYESVASQIPAPAAVVTGLGIFGLMRIKRRS